MLPGVDLPLPRSRDPSRLTGGSIGRFTRDWPVKNYTRHQLIIQPDDQLNSLYLIKSGFVREFDISAHGDEHVLWYGRPGDIFATPRLFDESYRCHHFYDAFSDCQLRVIDAKSLSDYVEGNTRALVQLTKYLAADRDSAEMRLQALAEPKASAKVLRILEFFARRFGTVNRRRQVSVRLALTHQDIANFLGLTRETVSHELNKLRELGVVDYHNADISVDVAKLSKLLSDA
ncbi:MAG TPA: Crp/Fnr family transcriptional regulator [Candidatus Saccharimonadales bacterium]|nr:Crp/Fnr family transcriptional regulator [Candidatus Saccharimonadales bacterium]